MRRLSLGGWLALICVGVTGVAILIVVPRGWSLLEQLAMNDAKARVELAAITAAETITRRKAETLAGAEVLASRPTLDRLLATGQFSRIAPFIEQFRRASLLDGCAVVAGGRLVAATDDDSQWENLASTPGVRFEGVRDRSVEIVAVVALDGDRGELVVVRRTVGSEDLSSLGQPVLEVRFVETPASSRPGGGAGESLSSLRTLDGEGSPAIEAVMNIAELEATLLPAKQALLGAVIVASAMAITLGIFAGHRVAAPVRRLRESADRIGAGDLETSVPGGGLGEVGPLSDAMEGMRHRLRSLTAELRHREFEAQALLSGIVEGVFAVDTGRRIQYLNPQAAAILGVDATEVVGRFCGDVLQPLAIDGEKPCDHDCPIIHSRSRGRSRSVEHLDLSSGRRTVVITSAPASAGRQVQLIRDETETETARRSRDAVLANVSHELRTPLSAQLASIELLLDGLDRLKPQESRSLVGSIQRSTLRLKRLVDNLLESVKIETGMGGMRRIPLEMTAVVDDAMVMTVPLLEQKSQSLEVCIPEDLPDMVGDPDQLVQAFINLIGNAHKYAPEGSCIRVEAAAEGGWVAIRVEDEGPGIGHASSSSIFDRFERGATDGQGMGLGLWIVRNIAERHGGSIDVTPGDKGGARFIVRLPISRET